MKRHLIFCCNYECLKAEMRKVITEGSFIKYTESVVINNDDEYRFYSQINNKKEKVYGILLDDYKTCGNYLLDERLEAILRSHMNRKKKE